VQDPGAGVVGVVVGPGPAVARRFVSCDLLQHRREMGYVLPVGAGVGVSHSDVVGVGGVSPPPPS